MKCADCPYHWKENWEDCPSCHYRWNDGYAPCEVEDDYEEDYDKEED